MRCPTCGQEIFVKERSVSYDSRAHKPYDKVSYQCKADDTWVHVETPKEE